MNRLVFLAAMGCLALRADTIVYTDFGPAQTYDTGSGKAVGNSFPSIAEGFTPTANGALGQVDLALAYFSPDPPQFDLSISLQTDASGLPSGTTLDSWTLSDNTITSTPTVYSFLSTLNPVLSTANAYWLVITDNPSDPNGYVWLENTQGVTGEDYNNGTGWQIGTPSSDYVSLAFDVQTASASAPEPGSGALMGLATLLALGVSRFRKSR
jgi:hypothetical protein